MILIREQALEKYIFMTQLDQFYITITQLFTAEMETTY